MPVPTSHTVLSLADARDALLALPGPYSRAGVEQAVLGLRPSREEVEPYINFSPDAYTRTLFYRGPRFEILVLCWEDGQASPIHDHAASICTMAIIEGVCRSDNFRIAGGRASCDVQPGETVQLQPAPPEEHAEGDVVTVTGGDIHRVGNFQGNGRRLVTVHFYLPSIRAMRCYDEATGKCWVTEPATLLPTRP